MPDSFVTPPALSPGDEVAVVAPAANPASEVPHVLDRAEQTLRDTFDLEPVRYPTAERDTEWLAAHPRERARDVHEAFRDPNISGVFAVIGGNDQIRVTPHIDRDVLRDNPTRFYGTSDNTVLANELWRAGVVSYYGGTLMTDLAVPGGLPDYNEEMLARAFFDDAMGEYRASDRFTDQDLDWRDPENLDRTPEYEPTPGLDWRGGDRAVTGRAWGGCLEVVDTVLAADRAPPLDAFEDAVLFLESSEEMPSVPEVRRFLMAMGERGILPRVGAVLVGRPKARTHVDERPPEEREAYRQDQYDTVAGMVADYNPDAPVVCGVDVGHTTPTFPVPNGARATVDPAAERVAFE